MKHQTKDQIKLIGLYVAGFTFVGVFAYYSWQIGRTINYNWSYKDMVQETICETVKHEHLINPKACK